MPCITTAIIDSLKSYFYEPTMIELRVKQLRERNSFTQEDVVFGVCRLANERIISLSGYKKVESGKIASVNLAFLDALCDFYGCGVQDILVKQ